MVTCVEGLVNECEGSKVMEYLSLMVNIKQMKKGVHNMCEKIECKSQVVNNICDFFVMPIR